MSQYEKRYGKRPMIVMQEFRPDWHEFMHYLYLPVRIPARDESLASRQFPPTKAQWHIPPQLEFLGIAVSTALANARVDSGSLFYDPYVYVSARRGMASPDNPLNRPGWHTDDFGGEDLNFIWSDRWPTRILVHSEYSDPAVKPMFVPQDDGDSMRYMEFAAEIATHPRSHEVGKYTIEDAPAHAMIRLDPYVIHSTPLVPHAGMRSFFKISISNKRYDLLGNSHNYGIHYDWRMVTREEVRNHQGSNKDHS